MSVNASWLRMFIEMRKRHKLDGRTLALGVQDVMFTHETAEALLAEAHIEEGIKHLKLAVEKVQKGNAAEGTKHAEEALIHLKQRGLSYASIPVANRRYHLSRNQKQFTSNPNHYMCVKDLFQMLGFSSLDTLDAFGNDQPDIEWDLCQPIPKEMHNRYDLLFDIGVLEHTSDIFQALENVGNLVKPGGWIILYLPMVSPINSSMYHPNPPFYFDILSGNGFGDFDAWINWMPDWDQQNDIRTIWLNYQYNDDVYIWRPRYFTVMWFMARKMKHVGEFRPVLQNFYKEWHAGMELFGTSQEELTRTGKLMSD